MKTDTAEKKRFPEVEALRGVASLLVLLYHYTYIYNRVIGFRDQPLFQMPLGKIGVHIFFIISGFVILITLKRSHNILDFAVSRFSRLYPAYWVSLILTTCVVTFFSVPTLQVPFTHVIANITMLPIGFSFVDPVYWTLKIELLFYFTMAALFLLKALDLLPRIMLAWQTCALVAPLLEPIAHLDSFIVYNKIHALLNFEFIHLFAIGLVFYFYRSTGRLAITGVASILLAFIKQYITSTPEMTLLVVFVTGCFLLIVKGRLHFINLRPLVFLGTISYPLYLTHRNIGFAIIQQLEKYNMNTNLAIVCTTFVAIITASIITYLVEKPAMNAIRRTWYGKTRARCT